jgi:hypothetical protein
VKELVTNTAIGVGDGNTSTRHQVIVMDEVDGMSGTSHSLQHLDNDSFCSMSMCRRSMHL